MKSVLFIHNAGDWAPIIAQALTEGFAITHVTSTEAALPLMQVKNFDVVLVDSAVPGSLSFPERIGQARAAMICMYLSDRAQTNELVDVFRADYDEYLALPLEPLVVNVRVLSRLKDRSSAVTTDCILRGSLRIAIPQQRVVQLTVNASERDLELTPNEFRIFYALVVRERLTLSREQILKEVWGGGLHVEARTIDKHICSLRRKLEADSKALVSVAGKGYFFDSRLTGVTGAGQTPRTEGANLDF